jgi:hypothetical protein
MSGLREVLFEFYRIGAYVKVSAVDPVTTIEVQIVGPAGAGRDSLEALAVRKLKRAIKARRGQAAAGTSKPPHWA